MLSANQLEKIRQEYNLPKEKTFKLDTKYKDYLFSLDSSKFQEEIKNHYQPLQATYYDKTGQMISFHVNCYAGVNVIDGDDLKWNQHNVFNSFVPASVAPLDSLLPLSKHLKFIKTFDNKDIDTTDFSTYDYTIIIHWGQRWKPRDCKNLLKIIGENTLLAKGKSVNILYVNNDNSW